MSEYLDMAVEAAETAGRMLRDHYETELNVDEMHPHDIKLELDVKSQDLITEMILAKFPGHAIYGEEGLAGDQRSACQWIVDPIDGTVNFYYGIPHFGVSIALRQGDELLVGVIRDPMREETWAVEKGGVPRMNGRPIRVSSRDEPAQAVVTVGFAKTTESLEQGMRLHEQISRKVRKIRVMGSAALGMAYVACGRLDAYIEPLISLWDIAAGKLLVEAAGGNVELTPIPGQEDKFSIRASNGRLEL